MIPNPGAFVRMNFIFSAGSLNRAVSLVRHRANHASTPYCQGAAISHAVFLRNVANLSAYITRVRDVNEGKFHYQLPTINSQLIGKA